ncbi:MAG: 3-deoxy-D-manno-octulosonate 8-phosphate phosphatase [Bacteroidales bacterium]|nr:3-deoxy-D-manno-octulosonate 8-phosphate phosphatase [Bacteroidales bacterium]
MIDYDLTQIRALVFDVDGVLSSNQVVLLGGQPVRTANIKDGYALQLAAKSSLKMAIITGGKNEAVRERYLGLGISDVYMGASVKLEVFEDWLLANELLAKEVLYVGDDIPDFEIMERCGCPCCPSDAAPEIKAISRYISPYKGGEGCVRDVVEQVLKAHKLWLNSAEAFGW